MSDVKLKSGSCQRLVRNLRTGQYPKPKHKYSAKPVERNGFHFASKAEARYAAALDLRVRAGEVVGYLKQVPLHLPGKTRYVVDFLIFEADGNVRFVDVKGVETETFKLKARQVEQLYPWLTLEVVKG